MTSTTNAARPSRAANKPQGQWAVDGKAPLNHNEEFKAADNGLNVRQRIIDDYSVNGFDSIPSDDLHGRFRWWGLYTQRKQGIDGGRTSKLEADELSDKYFMMRVRLDGGAITTDQLRVLAGISREFARDTGDISDRQNLQYHWIRVEDVPEIWRRLDEAGMDTVEACGDTPRVILGSPVAGIAADEIIDPTPVIQEIRSRYLNQPEYSNLPRKFKSAVTGHPSLDVVHEINDISLVGVEHPELGAGYDLWVGGGLSTVPRLAERVGVFVRPEEAAEVWAGVVSIFRDYGYRRQRTRARLKFLIGDWGVAKFREVLETEYLQRKLPDGPAPAPARAGADHLGVNEQRDGRVWVGVAPTVGRASGTLLDKVADLAEQAGSGRIRFTPHQKILILDVEPDKAETLVDQLAEIGLYARPSVFRRGTMACTGIEYCKLAFVETKGLAADVIDELERRLADLELTEPLSININGCQNSCARIQVADIGLKGQLIAGEEFGFQVHLGGGLVTADREAGELGRTVRGLKVTAANLADYIERVVRRWHTDRADGETFAAWAHRADEEAVA
ncbi:sulfite reductase (ferredoxin) [Propionibacteriaceae bacterium ES.041]|uniref:nitrite/sulfite reductase n=1 Tax=Enemella evansiae TaxID=2016499 RepID=UPI000B96D2A5|nr:nitrite/sulfite reductase [Enemella evansiae]OYN99304.1 sulfite reductase [Enemella evansiae]PFG67126.1 sulfite reductase (ferredoxin) [Propionibacteriaceae bacterium ES.041]